MKIFTKEPPKFADGYERKTYVEKVFNDVEQYTKSKNIDDYEVHFYYGGFDIHADGHVIQHIDKWTKSQIRQFLQGLGD